MKRWISTLGGPSLWAWGLWSWGLWSWGLWAQVLWAWVLCGWCATSAAAFEEKNTGQGAVIVMYHRFGEEDIPSTNIRLSQFETHLRILKTEGYSVLPVPDILKALREGTPLPDRTAGITADDAYESFYRQGWPRLKAMGFPVTLFVATGEVGGSRMMTWDQIREVRDAGVTLGLHGAAHPHLPQLSPEAQRADFKRAFADFARETGERPTLLSYPYGEADATSVALAREFGITGAFGQNSGAVDATARWAFLPRFALNETYGTEERFRRVIASLPLPITEIVPDIPNVRAGQKIVYVFSVADTALDLSKLACYGPDGAAEPTEVKDRRVTVSLRSTAVAGRARINCTLPGPRDPASGAIRWRWHGAEFTVLRGDHKRE